MSRHARTAASLLVAALVLAAAACGGDGDDDAEAVGAAGSGAPSTAPATAATAAADPEGVEAFCDRVQEGPEEIPESAMGSPEHIAFIEGFLAVAPDEIRPDVEVFHDFLVEGGISADDPDSNLVENFPPPARDASDAVVAYIEQHC